MYNEGHHLEQLNLDLVHQNQLLKPLMLVKLVVTVEKLENHK